MHNRKVSSGASFRHNPIYIKHLRRQSAHFPYAGYASSCNLSSQPRGLPLLPERYFLFSPACAESRPEIGESESYAARSLTARMTVYTYNARGPRFISRHRRSFSRRRPTAASAGESNRDGAERTGFDSLKNCGKTGILKNGSITRRRCTTGPKL
jgi:hypothetical protein